MNTKNNILDFIEKNAFIQTIFEDKVSLSIDEIDDELYDLSKEESEEMLEKIETILENVVDGEVNLQETEELKRCLHTFKGSVRMAGANKMGTITHRLESLLDFAEAREIPLYKLKEIIDYEINKVKVLIKNPKATLSEKDLEWLDSLISVSVPESETKVNNNETEVKTVIVKKEEKQSIRVDSNLIDDFINDSGEIRLSRTSLENIAELNQKNLNDLKGYAYKLVKQVKEIEIQAEGQIQAGSSKLEDGSDFDPLEFDRFTRLQELTRFMNETLSDINDTIANLTEDFKNQDNVLAQQEILSNGLLDSLMNIRLVSIDTISERLYKITRNTSKEVDKKVALKLIGEKTEIDRLVLDKIISPIEHILRNCISHGIEIPELRVLQGKPIFGNVKIETVADGNFIIISISDDGAGINVEKVKEIGLRKGLIKADIDYSQEEIIDLIFQSGFSTADNVSQVSGRGVGMDVVKNEILALGGIVTISTEKNVGSTFKITLPVAVATNQAILTDNMGKLIAIPALLVTEIISIKKDKLKEFYAKGAIKHRDKEYPLYYMGHMFGLLPHNKEPEIKSYNTVIIISYLDQEIVVHIDKLKTTTEILIKKVGSYLNKISGILGATVLGDGTQGIIVNPVLLKSHYEKYIINEEIQEKTVDKNNKITVMVVDDSITVRRATGKLLERNNYNVIFGKDGGDALEVLQLETPDIILSDIEMPGMDGFEFVKNLKAIEKYENIPIVMITSRTADKHKNYALSIGVNEYLGKPYQEEELLRIIKSLLN